MKTFAILLYLGTVGLAAMVSGCATNEPAADLIVTGGRIYTMNPSQPQVQALAVRGDKIVFAGTREGALARKGDNTRMLDLDGGIAIPGLIDAHAHLPNLGRLLQEVNLNGTTTTAEIRDLVTARISEARPGEWIQGRGWDQNDWQVKSFPTWRDLRVTEANPVCLRRVDGHAVWMNRVALDMSGVTRDTPDPDGGRIVRDEGGEPTGVLVDRAKDLVTQIIPLPSMEELLRRIRLALAECRRFGLTGVHDGGTTEADLAVYRTLLERDELTLRVYTMLDSDSTRFVREQMAVGAWSDPRHFVNVRAIKIYADGALGSRGAALIEPYSDEPSHRGLILNPRSDMEDWVERALESGFQMCAHAIGDGGNRLILDIYQAALDERPVRDHRFRIEHAQVVTLADIPRFAELGVVASIQPTHATSDMYWAEDRIGPERIKGAYAWRKLMDAGAMIACGSDFPVEGVNPLWGIYAAVTRQDHKGWPEGSWYPDERMTVYEAVAGFTRGAAYASFEEDIKGTLEPGKLADVTVLDKDLFEIPAAEILATRVRLTMVGGRVVYTSEE